MIWRNARIAGLVARRCGSVLVWLLPISWLLGAIVARTASDAIGRAAGLHLPAMTCVVTVAMVTITSWPAFARGRPGVDWITRLRPGPLLGCGAAAIGALVAAAMGLLLTGVMAPWLVPDLPMSRAHVPLVTAATTSMLTVGGAPLQLTLPTGTPMAELWLHPVALAGEGLAAATTLHVEIDGAPVATPLTILGDHLWRLPLDLRNHGTVTLRATGGSLALAFPPGALEVITAAEHGSRINAALALLVQLAPCLLALALATLLGPSLALPVVLAGALTVLLVTTLGQLTPTNDALRCVLQGRWLLGERALPATLAALGVGVAMMVLAMLRPTQRAS